MLRNLAIVPLVVAVLCFSAPGCSNKTGDITFNPVPEGTPTVTGAGAPPPKGGGNPPPAKAKPVVEQ